MPKDTEPARPTTWVEVDLADAEFVVKEHPDGMFTIDINAEQPLVADAEQMRAIVRGVATLGKAKRWTG